MNSSRQLAASPSHGPRVRGLLRLPLIMLATVLVMQGTSGAAALPDVGQSAPPDSGPAAVERASVATQQAVRLNPPRPRISADYVPSDLGCADDTTAAGLEKFFAGRVGPLIGHDSPRVYPLGHGRFLWILQDAFIDYSNAALKLADAQYTHSTAMIQDGACFVMYQRGTPTTALSFEPGGWPEPDDSFFWPGGGAISGDVFNLFWIEIRRDPPGARGPLDGPSWHPVRTWLVTYDLATLRRIRARPATNDGVAPIYGFDVVTDTQYSYLFANTFQENLALEGHYENGPHSATKMWLARVPVGRLDLAPEYRTAAGWSPDPLLATTISSRFWTENRMLTVLIGDRWIATTKVNGYLGDQVAVDVAEHPWGPWTTVSMVSAMPRGEPAGMVTYHAVPMPWLEPDGDLIVGLSEIHIDWSDGGQPDKYRPRYFDVPLPP